MNPIELYKLAVKKVPQLKWFLGVAAIISLIVVCYGWIKQGDVPLMFILLGFLFMTVGAVVVILVANRIREPISSGDPITEGRMRFLGIFFFWSISLLVIGVMFALMSSVLFDVPHLFESIHRSISQNEDYVGKNDSLPIEKVPVQIDSSFEFDDRLTDSLLTVVLKLNSDMENCRLYIDDHEAFFTTDNLIIKKFQVKVKKAAYKIKIVSIEGRVCESVSRITKNNQTLSICN